MPPNRLQINGFRVVVRIRTDGAPCSADCVTCEVAALITNSLAEKLEGFESINIKSLRIVAAELEENKIRWRNMICEKRKALAAARKQVAEMGRVREKISVKEGELNDIRTTCEDLKEEMAVWEARVVLVKERERLQSWAMQSED